MNIAILAYNRIDSLKRLLDSLKSTRLIDTCDVYIFLDYNSSKISRSEIWTLLKNYTIADIYESEINLGLKENMHRVLKWASIQSSPTMVLEDDLYVSKNAIDYAIQVLDFYIDEPRIGMYSLYHQHYIYTTEFPFIPLIENSDVYMMQFPSSSGFVVTSEIANKYIQFVQKHNDNNSFPIHPKISNWPDTSWKKIYTAFLVKENLYTVFPRISYTTNFGEKGENHHYKSNHFQSLLSVFETDSFTFKKLNSTFAIYDHCMEWQPSELLFPDFKNTTFDLNGAKNAELIDTDWVITLRKNKEHDGQYARRLKPQEANIIEKMDGDTFYKINKVQFEKAKLPKKFYQDLIDYHYIFTSKKSLLAYVKDSLF